MILGDLWVYLGLFFSAFLAATILPFSSEGLLSVLYLKGYSAALLLLFATVGNVLGSCTNYGLGYFGGNYLVEKVLRLKPEQFKKAEQRYQKFGYWSLLFAWVPIIGDPITVVAGVLRIKFLPFLILVLAGKFTRYATIIYLIAQHSASNT